MIKKKNKKSLIKRILAFTGAIFCSIVCAFSLFNYSDTKSMEVSADSYENQSVVFNGSDLWFPFNTYYINYSSNTGFTIIRTIDYGVSAIPSDHLNDKFQVSFIKDLDNNWYFTYPITSFKDDNGDGYYYCGLDGYVNNPKGRFSVSYYNNSTIYFANDHVNNSPRSYCLYFTYSQNFDFNNIIGFNVATFFDRGSNSQYVRIRYFNANSEYINFSIFCASNFSLLYRDYFLVNTLDFTDNEYYNQGFSAGQSSGYNSGYSAGETAGYSSGYSSGQAFGYNSGYEAGLEDSNQYTFLSLVSSVIDAPMSYFTSLFNFELLGVNLQAFLMALFTLCVIVTLVKLCMGG